MIDPFASIPRASLIAAIVDEVASTHPRGHLEIARYLAGVSQDDVARLSGITREQLSNIERGKHKPRRMTKAAIAHAFGLEVEDLFPA